MSTFPWTKAISARPLHVLLCYNKDDGARSVIIVIPPPKTKGTMMGPRPCSSNTDGAGPGSCR